MHRSYGEERQEKIIGHRPKHDVKLLIFFFWLSETKQLIIIFFERRLEV